MLAIFTTMVAMAADFPPDARFMPLIVGIPGIALCLLQLALDALRAGRFATYRFRTAPKAGKPADLASDLPEFGPHTVSSELRMWIYFLAFIAAVLGFGFYVAVPIMLVTFLRREAKASWRLTLVLGGGATAVLYLMFSVLFHIRLHPGFITPAVTRGLGF